MNKEEITEKAQELTIKNVTDGKNKYFSWGFFKGCVIGLEYNNKQVAELEEKISFLLSCKNCPENKGGLICAKEYENKCLAQKIQFIKELQQENADLEKENEELKERLKNQKADYETYYESCYNAQKRAEKKHTKAKELLKRWLKLYNTNTVKGIIADTEQFISEVEK